jgi:hypothetical protein
MVLENYRDKWYPYYQEVTQPVSPPARTFVFPNLYPTREEVDQLRREVEDMRELIKRAKIYDAQNNEPDCELEEKVEFVKGIAALVGISLEDVLENEKNSPADSSSVPVQGQGSPS